MSNYKINVAGTRRTDKLNKPCPSSTSRGRTLFKDTESGKKNLQPKLSYENELAKNKLQKWQKRMLNTFEMVLLQLDELFMNLRSEERFKGSHSFPILSAYQDICEKLRLEVLIAIDKLGLVSSTKEILKGNDIKFINKMRDLKCQLSDIRWQYHNAVKKLEMDVV